METPSVFLPQGNPMNREAWQASGHGGLKRLRPTWQLNNTSEDPKIPITPEVGMILETGFNFQTPILLILKYILCSLRQHIY